MTESHAIQAELPNLVSILAKLLGESSLFSKYLFLWENIIFSLIIVCVISLIAYFGCRKRALVPGRLQGACEAVFGGMDDFICGILGAHGRKYTPFIGTLFLYILFMNLSGLVPFIKSPTSSWSVTFGLALCVFAYVQFTAIREMGIIGYFDYLMERPRGFIAFSVFIPVMMLFLSIISQLVRPISLSLRLRSNIWGDDMLLGVLAGLGAKGIPLLVFSSLLAIMASVVQAVVFCLLSTIYFALVLTDEETH